MAKLKGLGRGLDALLAETETREGERLLSLPLDSLQPGKYQPRTHMDETALNELAESIRSEGLVQPILAREIGAGRYEIVAGERRWRASRIAGLGEIPVLVREIGDAAALKIALIENMQREDLNPMEEAQGLQRLLDEFEMTHQDVAGAVGRSRTAVTNILRLLNLGQPVQAMLADGRLDMGHARALLALSPAQQLEAAHEVVKKGLSVRETERLVARLLQPEAVREVKKDRDVLRLEEEVSERLGTQVSIRANRKGAGRLSIAFDSLDQLDGILQRLS